MGIYPSPNFRLYGQIGYRTHNTALDNRLNWAGVAGIRYKGQNGRWQWDVRTEYRSYGGGFNYKLNYERNVHYRDTEQTSHRGNLIGDQLYPIHLFFRPFSQWAVFTEYHKKWICGYTLYADIRYRLLEKLFLSGILDINQLQASGEHPFTYAFFIAGLTYQPIPGFEGTIGVTNRAMNLDKHFPTLYQTRYPMMQFEIRKQPSTYQPWPK